MTAQDLGSLLQSAKFCMVTLDSELVTSTYPDLHYIMEDLQVGHL